MPVDAPTPLVRTIIAKLLRKNSSTGAQLKPNVSRVSSGSGLSKVHDQPQGLTEWSEE